MVDSDSDSWLVATTPGDSDSDSAPLAQTFDDKNIKFVANNLINITLKLRKFWDEHKRFGHFGGNIVGNNWTLDCTGFLKHSYLTPVIRTSQHYEIAHWTLPRTVLDRNIRLLLVSCQPGTPL